MQRIIFSQSTSSSRVRKSGVGNHVIQITTTDQITAAEEFGRSYYC